MSNSRIIEFSTINLKRLSRVGDVSSIIVSDISPDSMIEFEISGLLKDLSLKERLSLYNSSEANGLSKKLTRVLYVKESIKGVNIK